MAAGAGAQSSLTADDVEHGAVCVVAGSLQPPVVRAALLAGASTALAALLALPGHGASLLDDAQKVILTGTDLERSKEEWGSLYPISPFKIK